MVLVLLLVQVVLSNTLSTSGVELGEINFEISSLKTQNAIIKEKYLKEASLVNLAERAEKLGFASTKSQFVLSGSGSVLTSSLSLAVR